MICPRCTAAVVAMIVPDELIEYAPAPETAICTRCLSTWALDESETSPSPTPDPALATVDPAFPGGEAGIALALACGLLESFALNRASIEALVEYAEQDGADVLLFFDRLDAGNASFDLERRRAALLDIL